jgi:hypothetical protein
MNSNVLEAVRNTVWALVCDEVRDPSEDAVRCNAEMSVMTSIDKDVWRPTADAIYSSVYAATERKLDEYRF